MKLADAKKVADLVDKLKLRQADLKMIREAQLFVAFGDEEAPRREWVVMALAPAPAQELRERIINSAITDIEKIKEQLVGMGVEL